MAIAQEQRISYLTYPVCAGITVTFSRGISPHSAAGRKAASALSCMNLTKLLYDMPLQIARAFSLFPPKNQAPDPMIGGLPLCGLLFRGALLTCSP